VDAQVSSGVDPKLYAVSIVSALLQILLAEGLLPRAISLPEGLDPDEFVQKYGADRLRQEVKDAPDLFLKLLDQRKKEMGVQPSHKIQLLDEITPLVRIVKDQRLRDLYVKEIATRFSFEEGWLQKVVSGIADKPRVQTTHMPQGQAETAKAKTVPPKAEAIILNMVLFRESFLQKALAARVQELLSDDKIRDLFTEIGNLYGQRPNDFDKFTSILISKYDESAVFTRHLNPNEYNLTEEQAEKLFTDCIERLRSDHFRGQAKRIASDIKAGQGLEKLEQFVNMVNAAKEKKSNSGSQD